MSNRHTSPPTDGPPIWSLHSKVLEASGEPADSTSMRNAQMTIARLSTYASARIYAGYLARFFAFMAEQGREPIAADHDDIDLYLMTQRHLSPKTQSCQWGVLSSFFKRALERRTRSDSPFLGRKRPSDEPITPTPALTKEQAQSLLNSMAADFDHPDRGLVARRDFAMIALLLHLCLRATEVSDVRWGGISRSSGELTLSFTGKGRRPATLPLPGAVHSTLLMWKAAYESKTATVLLPGDPIFLATDHVSLREARSRKDSKPLPRIVTRSVGRIVADRISDVELNLVGGMPAARFAAHCLRATGATLAVEGGADAIDLQALLRHMQLDTSIRYLRRLENRSAKAIAMIGLSLDAALPRDDGHEVAESAGASDVEATRADLSDAPQPETPAPARSRPIGSPRDVVRLAAEHAGERGRAVDRRQSVAAESGTAVR